MATGRHRTAFAAVLRTRVREKERGDGELA
jgi:hypothetical protein